MKVCKSACALAVVFAFASAFAFGQTASQSGGGVSMPAITAPSMPTVSVPTIGGGFYTPTAPKSSAVNKKTATTAAATTTQEQTAATQPASEATQRAVAAQSAQALGLTASDLSSMDSLGLLSSGVLGGNNLSSLAAKSLGNTTSLTGTTDSLLLQQILTQLTELKAQVAKQNAPDAQAATKAVSAVTETYTQEAKTGHKILRFVVNGYDVLSTCRDIYFSTQEADGSFLLTGDRKYLSSGANRSETFHLLFRAKGSKEGITHYAVTSAVTQDYTNEYSFLYQLSEREQLTAEQTGNFISLRVNEPNWKCDLLLSLDD